MAQIQVAAQIWQSGRLVRKADSSQTLISTGKMNVESAWSLTPKWCCPIAAIQCASTAIATGKNLRSESCPFCRGTIKRVQSGGLWVLTYDIDVVDPKTVLKENVLRLYLYINSLPKDVPDALFLTDSEYLI
ncbi:E3 ubiquitin-protein ligase AIRP2 [Bienertia sinuspersici]